LQFRPGHSLHFNTVRYFSEPDYSADSLQVHAPRLIPHISALILVSRSSSL
jgi:hypothetical protein